MTVKPYGQKEALALLEHTRFQDEWMVDDQGLTSDKGFLALPFPFDGRDLAGFMLKDSGSAVAHFYGGWDNGPAESMLDENSLLDNLAKRAVREAFAAYRDAVTKVGTWDADALARHEAAHKAYWNSDNDQALLKAFEDAQAEWDAANRKWLTAMVVCLLEPKSQAEPNTSAPVATESASNAPAWTVSKPQRYSGYAAPLHRLIDAAYRDGGPRPTARDVLEAWRLNKPAEVAKVLSDGFDYYDAQGNTKYAGLEAIRKSIIRLTSTR